MESCGHTVGDTIWGSMKRELSTKVGKDFTKREKGGESYYQTKANKASLVG